MPSLDYADKQKRKKIVTKTKIMILILSTTSVKMQKISKSIILFWKNAFC